MDNKSYIKQYELKIKRRKIEDEIENLDNFFKTDDIASFKNKNSIEALKKINEYLRNLKTSKENIDNLYFHEKDKFNKKCKHEIMIKYGLDSKLCIFCRKKWFIDNDKNLERYNFYLNKENIEIAEKYLLNFSYYFVKETSILNEELILKIVYDICKNNENLIEKFSDYIDIYIKNNNIDNLIEFHKENEYEKERYCKTNKLI